MRQTLTIALILLSFGHGLIAQPNYTANDSVPAYTGPFGVGVNMGFYANWSNAQQAVIAAGDPALGIKGVGANTIRPGMTADVYANFGYTISQPDFAKYQELGMSDFTGIIGGPPEWFRDYTTYCPGVPSTLFKDMYLPIWDNALGTPINEANHYANYLYKVVNQYKDYVTFWEIWNEPGFDYTNGNGRKLPGEPGNWWDNDPNPCDYKLRAPIQHYVRMLRISWEVIKTLDPNSYVTIGDPGFPSFLDAVLRNTDNPNGGAVTPEFPLKGGAYFDCMTFHSYPHFDFSAYDPDNNLFKRHSDGGADGLIVARNRFQNVLNNYGYNGVTYPKKLWNITEYNVPRVALTGPWMQGENMQINYLLKVLMRAKVEKITQMHIYNLFDVRTPDDAIDEFDLMGMYANNTGVLPYNQVVNPQGKAMRTFSLLLGGSTFDPAATAAMNLPAGVGGYAFRLPTDSIMYALWAKTQTDLSETASATYSFPTALGLDSLTVYNWDFGYTNTSSVKHRANISLNARPQFFTRKVVANCLLTTTVSQINCSDNGTSNNSADDLWSFTLTVTNNGATGSWRTTIGTNTITGVYGTPKLINNLQISAGNLSLVIRDVNNQNCTKTISVTAPAPCSVPPATNYCQSQSEFPWHDWIAGFAVGNLNNSSGKSPYSDFTSISTTLTRGQTYSANLTPGFSWLSFNEYWRVWIDFNKNKVFEPSELVLDYAQPAPPNGATNTTAQANLVIPAGAATGTTRMRVSMRRATFSGPCDLVPFGEVEDYNVNIVAGGAGTCSIVANISDILCNDNGTPTIGSDDTYTFKALVTGTNTGSGWSANTGTSVVSGSYGQQRVLGPFSILNNVQVTFTDNANATCTTVANVTKPNPCSSGGGNGTYCTSTSDFPWHDWIAQIKVADLDNVSGKSQYSHFPNSTATVQRNGTYPIQLTGGFSWLVEDEYWRIWIDYNRDGNFTNNEIAFSEFNPKLPYAAALWSINGTITIPDNVPTGLTRMRIVMRRGNTPPNPCGNYPNGETEDYSINITSGSGGGSTCNISAVTTSLACQNKGTASPLDDTYSFDLLVTGAGSVSSQGWNATVGGSTISGSYGQAKSIQNRLISAGVLNITVTDASTATCTTTVNVTPPPPCSNTAGPCTITSAFPWHEWINKVKFGGLNHTSGKSVYSDFTSQTVTVKKDSSYVATLGAGFSWAGFNQYWRIWVDGNNDGDWTNNEIVLSAAVVAQPYDNYGQEWIDTIRFNQIPVGTHKMRVVMRRNQWPAPCGSLDYGEAEDYTVVVVQNLQSSSPAQAQSETETSFDGKWALYPNPAGAYFILQTQSISEYETVIQITDGMGKIVERHTMAANAEYYQFFTDHLSNGIYHLHISQPGQRSVVRKVVILKE